MRSAGAGSSTKRASPSISAPSAGAPGGAAASPTRAPNSSATSSPSISNAPIVAAPLPRNAVCATNTSASPSAMLWRVTKIVSSVRCTYASSKPPRSRMYWRSANSCWRTRTRPAAASSGAYRRRSCTRSIVFGTNWSKPRTVPAAARVIMVSASSGSECAAVCRCAGVSLSCVQSVKSAGGMQATSGCASGVSAACVTSPTARSTPKRWHRCASSTAACG
jgi:hypothetical protein